MKIYVPSMGRAGVLNSKIMTNKFIKKAIYVVPPDEIDRYKRALVQSRGDYDVIGCPVDGIAKTRHFIGKHAKENRLRTFCMMDDDLNFCVRKEKDKFNLRPAEPEDVVGMLEWLEKALGSFAHASISPRQANNVMVLPSGDSGSLVKCNKRTLRLLAYQTDEFLSVRHGRVPVMEDFDVNLQLLEAGHRNIVSYYWAQDQRETGSVGGCSSYRTLDAHNGAAHRLKELHPKFVELRMKKNRAGLSKAAEGLRERWEVTIQWQKAWESSR